MNTQRVIVLGVALVAAGGAAFLVRGMLGGGTSPVEAKPALVAPRPLFTWLALQDEYFPNWPQSTRALDQVWDLYRALGAADAMATWVGHGGHDFPAPVREAAYAFLARHLGPATAIAAVTP